MANQWRLSVVLGKYSKDEIDNRKLSDGLKCISYTEPVLREILSELDIEIPLVAQSLRMFCYNLITIICDYCVANNIEIKDVNEVLEFLSEEYSNFVNAPADTASKTKKAKIVKA